MAQWGKTKITKLGVTLYLETRSLQCSQTRHQLKPLSHFSAIHPRKRQMQSPSQASWAHRVALISVSIARHQLMLQDHGYGASVLGGEPIHAPAFAGTK